MRVGFTGTRKGLSSSQVFQFRLLGDWAWFANMDAFHHGGAVGADREAARILFNSGHGRLLHEHPAGDDPLARNRIIVGNSDILIAAPFENAEIQRSGTWATIREARRRQIPVLQLSR